MNEEERNASGFVDKETERESVREGVLCRRLEETQSDKFMEVVIITHFACCRLGNEEHVPLYGQPCLLHDVYSFSVLLIFFFNDDRRWWEKFTMKMTTRNMP